MNRRRRLAAFAVLLAFAAVFFLRPSVPPPATAAGKKSPAATRVEKKSPVPVTLARSSAPADPAAAARAARIAAILRDYTEMIATADAEFRRDLAADKDLTQITARLKVFETRLALLDRERRADLAPLVSPHELDEIDLRESRTGQRLRAALDGVTVTAEELSLLLALQRDYEERHPLAPASGDELASTLARAAFNTRFHDVLGAERFAAYMVREDPSYRRYLAVATDNQLPPDTAFYLWELKNEALGRAAEVAARPGLDRAQRAAAMQAVGQAVEARLASLVNPQKLAELDPATFGLLQALLAAARRGPP